METTSTKILKPISTLIDLNDIPTAKEMRDFESITQEKNKKHQLDFINLIYKTIKQHIIDGYTNQQIVITVPYNSGAQTPVLRFLETKGYKCKSEKLLGELQEKAVISVSWF